MKTTLKAIVGLGLLIGLMFLVDWREVWQHLSTVDVTMASIAFVLLTVQFPLSSWKWSWSLRLHRLLFRQSFLLRVLVVGFFINNFMPTSIGGDVYRVYRTVPSNGHWSRALSAVVVERITGLLALFMLGAIAAVGLAPRFPLAQTYLAGFLAGGFALTVSLYAIYKGWLKPLTRRLRSFKAFRALEVNLNYVLRLRKEWLALIGLSTLFQAIAILIVFLLYRGLGQDVSISVCALIASAAAIAAILPLSINGLGVVEATYAAAAVALNVNFEASVLVPILIRVLILPQSVVAGLVYLADRGEAGEISRLATSETGFR